MKKMKQILALCAVVLLVAMYVITLILAVFDSSATMSMFKASAVCTFMIPIMLYAYILVYKWLKK